MVNIFLGMTVLLLLTWVFVKKRQNNKSEIKQVFNLVTNQILLLEQLKKNAEELSKFNGEDIAILRRSKNINPGSNLEQLKNYLEFKDLLISKYPDMNVEE
jgi:hypothetical protein